MISSIEYMATGISLTAMKRDKRFTNRTIKKKLFFFSLKIHEIELCQCY